MPGRSRIAKIFYAINVAMKNKIEKLQGQKYTWENYTWDMYSWIPRFQKQIEQLRQVDSLVAKIYLADSHFNALVELDEEAINQEALRLYNGSYPVKVVGSRKVYYLLKNDIASRQSAVRHLKKYFEKTFGLSAYKTDLPEELLEILDAGIAAIQDSNASEVFQNFLSRVHTGNQNIYDLWAALLIYAQTQSNNLPVAYTLEPTLAPAFDIKKAEKIPEFSSTNLNDQPDNQLSAIQEGAIIELIDPDLYAGFLLRQSHQEDFFYSDYYQLRLGSTEIRLPYKELFGSGIKGKQEFIENKTLWISYLKDCADVQSHIQFQDFDASVERERQSCLMHGGYTRHPPKLWLIKYLEYKNENSLALTFGSADYLQHRVYQREMELNQAERKIFQSILHAPRGNNPRFYNCPWSRCGCGVWMITADHYLAISRRSMINVIEEKGKLSYSSSGACDRYLNLNGIPQDGTPGQAMRLEIQEELGLPKPRLDELILISLGIDIGRFLIQFSYVWNCPYTADDIRYHRRNHSTTADEQEVFFVPFQEEACKSLLLHCEFEPGAAVSLHRLLEKNFDLFK